ncbi:ABC transporter permease [Pimelobacter simplex]|uniref:ABC transporter permease n=1 Tax=Nocardioides simplex TaxID=2045 RepID=UPI001931B953|nr:ABC transporter permease [Pimelobacter simplex]
MTNQSVKDDAGALGSASAAPSLRARRRAGAWRRTRRLFVRVAELMAVLFLVSLGTFALLSLIDTDPAVTILGEGHTQADYEAVREDLGLNDPLLERYADWLGSAAHGDLGASIVPPYHDVLDRIMAALPVSVELALLGVGMALLFSIPLAMWSAYHAGGRIDRWISAGTFSVLSVPSFLAGLLLIWLLSNGLGWFPRAEWSRLDEGLGANLYHAFLPALTIALAETALLTRVLRSDLITTLQEDYILAARAKGMGTVHIMFSDALRPSSFSAVTILGISLGRLIGSTVIVEYLFALPGMGTLVVGAARTGDYVTVQGAVLVIALIYVATNALIDLSYGYLDPRVRRSHA